MGSLLFPSLLLSPAPSTPAVAPETQELDWTVGDVVSIESGCRAEWVWHHWLWPLPLGTLFLPLPLPLLAPSLLLLLWSTFGGKLSGYIH